MSDLINTIPEGKFRVVQSGSKDTVLINDFESSLDAFRAAQAHNSARESGDMFLSPLLVFNHEGSLVYGPADFVVGDMI